MTMLLPLLIKCQYATVLKNDLYTLFELFTIFTAEMFTAMFKSSMKCYVIVRNVNYVTPQES